MESNALLGEMLWYSGSIEVTCAPTPMRRVWAVAGAARAAETATHAPSHLPNIVASHPVLAGRSCRVVARSGATGQVQTGTQGRIEDADHPHGADPRCCDREPRSR